MSANYQEAQRLDENLQFIIFWPRLCFICKQSRLFSSLSKPFLKNLGSPTAERSCSTICSQHHGMRQATVMNVDIHNGSGLVDMSHLVSINFYDLPMSNDESGLVVYAARCSQSQPGCAAPRGQLSRFKKGPVAGISSQEQSKCSIPEPRWQDTGWWPQQIVDMRFSVSSGRIRHSRTRSGLASR